MPAWRGGVPALLRPLLSLTRETLAACARHRGPRVDRRRKQRRHAVPAATCSGATSHPSSRPPSPDTRPRSFARPRTRPKRAPSSTSSRPSMARARSMARGWIGCSSPPCRPRGQPICCAGSCAAKACVRRPDARLADMLRQLRDGSGDARTRIAHDGAEIGCYRGQRRDPRAHGRALRGHLARRGRARASRRGARIRAVGQRRRCRLEARAGGGDRALAGGGRTHPPGNQSSATWRQEIAAAREPDRLATPGAAARMVRRRAGRDSRSRRRRCVSGGAPAKKDGS